MEKFSAFMQRWLGNKPISRVIMILIGLAVAPALVVTISTVIREIGQIKYVHEEYRAIVNFHPLEEITSHATKRMILGQLPTRQRDASALRSRRSQISPRRWRKCMPRWSTRTEPTPPALLGRSAGAIRNGQGR